MKTNLTKVCLILKFVLILTACSPAQSYTGTSLTSEKQGLNQSNQVYSQGHSIGSRATPYQKSNITKVITLGSSKSEVAAIQGTPKSINRYTYSEVWGYDDYSTITFKNDQVAEWNNRGKLRVTLKGVNFEKESNSTQSYYAPRATQNFVLI